jgi:hypothetical protein
LVAIAFWAFRMSRSPEQMSRCSAFSSTSFWWKPGFGVAAAAKRVPDRVRAAELERDDVVDLVLAGRVAADGVLE